MRLALIILVGLLVVPACAQEAEWVPVESEISFQAEISEGIEAGVYEVFVRNDVGVALDVSMGLNFESVPSELAVDGYGAGEGGPEDRGWKAYEIEAEYEDVDGAQYFVHFGLEPGEEASLSISYTRENPGTENIWEKEYSYNSPVTLIFDGGNGVVYYEEASYSGELVLDEVDLVKCRDCSEVDGVVAVKNSRDFSVDWSVQKVPVRPGVLYFVFGGFLVAFILWELHKFMLGGHEAGAAAAES